MKILGIEYVDGEKRTAYADGEGGVLFKHESNLTPIIEANKASYNSIDERASWGEMTRVAEIPNSVIADLNRQGIMRGFHVLDQKRMKAWLNNPDNRYFRTRPGKV